MRIAVVGSGISGLSAAYLLARAHDVELFEAEGRLGGHAHTHRVEAAGRTWALDTGFLVYNERTYPNFVKLLAQLGISGQPSDMSFSVRCRRCGLEWASPNLGTMFAQPWRLGDPRHVRMVIDILRFFGRARAFLASDGGYDVTLGAFLDDGRYGRGCVRHFVLPMVGAIWSASPAEVRGFPVRSLLTFLDNHGLLAPRGAPPWLTIAGGSQRYVEAIAARLAGRVRTDSAVVRICRTAQGVDLEVAGAGRRRYDRVVIATHADQARALLADPSPQEEDLLGRFRYSINRTVLHTDRAALPDRRRAWASWNCDLADCGDERQPVEVTYHLNRLQSLDGGPEFCVSLNPRREPARPVLAQMTYAHPILDRAAVEAQAGIAALNGANGTFYCGAHLRYGFHEDGLWSALAVGRHFGLEL